jgi:hypothetical protein
MRAVREVLIEAKAAGAVVAEVNIEETPQSVSMNPTLLGKAGEILPKLMENWP